MNRRTNKTQKKNNKGDTIAIVIYLLLQAIKGLLQVAFGIISILFVFGTIGAIEQAMEQSRLFGFCFFVVMGYIIYRLLKKELEL